MQLMEPQSFPYSMEKIHSDPLVYKLQARDSSEAKPLFMTAIEDCNIKRSIPSTATTRSLLAGFQDIKIQKQFEHSAGKGTALVTLATAKLEEKNLEISSLTTSTGNCVRDAVVWTDSSEKPQESESEIENASRALLNNLELLFND